MNRDGRLRQGGSSLLEGQIRQVGIASEPGYNRHPHKPPRSERHGRNRTDERIDKQDVRAPHLGATLNVAATAQGSLNYPPGFTLPFNNVHAYEMSHGWNGNTEEQPVVEGSKQAGANNTGTTQGS
ncbi:hypothetical protein CR513_00834, partial [Mucuna pruriens]